jgi:2-methylisocitrate lyase-like PEP mutase family enzyme
LKQRLTFSLKTGAGTTMSRLGIADLGVATMNDMRDNAAMIASIDPTVPVIADADAGYGGEISNFHLIQALI